MKKKILLAAASPCAGGFQPALLNSLPYRFQAYSVINALPCSESYINILLVLFLQLNNPSTPSLGPPGTPL